MVENVKSTITETERAEKAYFITTKELAEAGRDNIPDELISSKHLIYSSPATLAYNSPGAQGFGVKRAGLAIPGSVMLLLAPGCCGRNTTILSELGGYGVDSVSGILDFQKDRRSSYVFFSSKKKIYKAMREKGCAGR